MPGTPLRPALPTDEQRDCAGTAGWAGRASWVHAHIGHHNHGIAAGQGSSAGGHCFWWRVRCTGTRARVAEDWHKRRARTRSAGTATVCASLGQFGRVSKRQARRRGRGQLTAHPSCATPPSLLRSALPPCHRSRPECSPPPANKEGRAGARPEAGLELEGSCREAPILLPGACMQDLEGFTSGRLLHACAEKQQRQQQQQASQQVPPSRRPWARAPRGPTSTSELPASSNMAMR